MIGIFSRVDNFGNLVKIKIEILQWNETLCITSYRSLSFRFYLDWKIQEDTYCVDTSLFWNETDIPPYIFPLSIVLQREKQYSSFESMISRSFVLQ